MRADTRAPSASVRPDERRFVLVARRRNARIRLRPQSRSSFRGRVLFPLPLPHAHQSDVSGRVGVGAAFGPIYAYLRPSSLVERGVASRQLGRPARGTRGR